MRGIYHTAAAAADKNVFGIISSLTYDNMEQINTILSKAGFEPDIKKATIKIKELIMKVKEFVANCKKLPQGNK